MDKDDAIKKLVARMKEIGKEILAIVKEIDATAETSSAYWLKKQREIRALYNEARKIAGTWTDESIPEFYRQAIKDELTKIKSQNIAVEKEIDYRTLVSSPQSQTDLNKLMKEVLNTFSSGFKKGENTLIRLSRLTQQINIKEEKVIKELAEGFETKATRKGASKRLQEELMKKAIDGKFVIIIDKNGNPRQWRIDAYAEMVARTKLQEASSQAMINTAVALDQDLVQVSSHNTLTPMCQEYEGKIYSLSGKDEDFPELPETPPFHPNCMHTLSIVIKEALENDGTLDKFSDFSKGKTEEYPVGHNFIPVSERKEAE